MIKIGILGVGYWGPNLVRTFINNKKCKLEIVCDLNEERLKYIKELYPSLEVTTSTDKLLKRNLDAVVIATPVSTHKQLAEKALKFGKNVFVEKPLTNNYMDALYLAELAEKNNLILAVGHIFQFTPSVRAIKQVITHNMLGNVFHFTSQRINLGPPKTTVNVLWDLAPHDLSILLYLFNEKPKEITSFGDSFWWNGWIDNAHMFLNFSSGKSAHIHVSWISSNKTRLINIFGENGNIVYDETKTNSEKVIFFDKGIDNRINSSGKENKELKYGLGETKKIKIEDSEPLALEIDSFLSSIESSEKPINNAEIGAEVVRIIEIANKNLKVGNE